MPANFKAVLPQLKELQEIDRRLKQIESELKLIPEQLKASGGEYLVLASDLQEKEVSLNAMTKERQGLEEDIKRLTTQLQDREKRLYAIKTQKEYQATLKEIAQMKRENKEREDRVLTLLEGSEKITQEITQLKSQTADKEGGFRQIETELKKREAGLESEQKTMSERRPALLKELPPEILKKYDLVRRRYPDALAAIKRGVCQGCNMNIPPQFHNEMLKMFDLKHCPSCHRLIYVDVEGVQERGTAQTT